MKNENNSKKKATACAYCVRSGSKMQLLVEIKVNAKVVDETAGERCNRELY
jgi:hypothetical protein